MPLQLSGTTNIQVSVNGNQMPGLLRASIATTNCFAADTYSITFAIDSSADIAFWSMISSAYLEVTAVVPVTSGRDTKTLLRAWPIQFMLILSREQSELREEISHLQ